MPRSNSIRFSDEIAAMHFETSGAKFPKNSYFMQDSGKSKSHNLDF
jgi:hypothetical protein